MSRMSRLGETDAGLHDEFARFEKGDSLRALVDRHGPILLGYLDARGATDAALLFPEIWARLVSRKFRGDASGWRVELFRAAEASLSTPRDGRSALFLALRGGLAAEQVAAVFAQSREAVAGLIAEAALGHLGEEPVGQAGHLAPSTVAGLCCGTLAEAELPAAAAHLTFCEICRGSAAALTTALSAAHAEPLPAVSEALREGAVDRARADREAQALVPRALRFTGVQPGARFRPLRLGVVGVLGFLLLASALTSIFSQQAENRKLTGALALHANPRLIAGAETFVSVVLRKGDNADAPPAADELVEVTLRAPVGPELAAGQARTNADGLALIPLRLVTQETMERSALLEARAEVGGERRVATLNVQVLRHLRQHLSADKPTYQPGQMIHLRGLSLDGGGGAPLAGKPVRIELRDPKGTRIAEVQTATSPMGVSAADVELSPGCALGHYTARMVLEGAETTVNLKVERYALPPFSVNVKAEVDSTDGRKPFDVVVGANFTTGMPLGRGMARLSVFAYGDEVFEGAAAIKEGKARFTVSLPGHLIANQYRAPTTLSLRAAVRDPAGRAETGGGGLELQGDAMALTVTSEATSLRRNLPRANHILVRAMRPGGKPVQTKVELFAPGDGELSVVGAGERLGEAETGVDGLATLDLPPAFFGRPLAVLATDPQDRRAYWTNLEPPTMREGGLVLGCARSLLRAGESLECEVFVPSPKARIVRADLRGQTVAMGVSPAAQGLFKVTLAVPTSAVGLLRITMEDAPAEDAVYALAAPADGLRVVLSGLEPKQPGEETTLRMQVTDGAGKPRAAAVGLAVVDAAVFARSAGQTPEQIIQALFTHPDIAPEGMALLFPEEPVGEEGGQGRWTPTQQAVARWQLAQASAASSTFQSQTTVMADQSKLASDRYEASKRAQMTRAVTVIALLAALFLTLCLVFFWFRTGVGAACAALGAAFGLKLFLTRFLDMRDNTVDPVALLVALGVFAGLITWSARHRRMDLRGVATAQRPGRGVLRGVLIASPVALLAVVGLLSAGVMRGPLSPRYSAHEESAPSPTKTADARFNSEFQKSASGPSDANTNGGAGLFQAHDLEGGDMPSRAVAASPPGALASAAPSEAKAESATMDRHGLPRALNAKPIAEFVKDQRAKAGGRSDSKDSPEVAVRQDFPETLYFNAAAVVGDDGAGAVSFRVADSMTTWEAHALANDARGALGAGRGKLVVKKDFHVDLDVPMDLTTGDDVTLQIAAQNERDAVGMAKLSATADSGVRLDTAPLAEPIAIAAYGIAGRLLSLKALAAGQQSVTLTGTLAGLTDALKRVISIWPNGREVKATYAGLIIDEVRRTIDVPTDAFAEGRSVILTLLGSPLAAALDGLDLLAAEPHGSFEQQASTVYINALILQALRATGRVQPAQEARFIRFMRLSYQDLLGYEMQGGGFSTFGSPGGHRAHLSAWGLVVLSELSRFTFVDDVVLSRTRARLADAQDDRGGFGPPAETAFIATALLAADSECLTPEDSAKPLTPEQRRHRGVCAKVVKHLNDAFSVVAGIDAYTLAWAADALLLAGSPYRARAEMILDELDRRAAIVGTGRLRRVTFAPRSATLYGSRGASSEVETTAIVAHALVKHGGRPEQAREAMRSLLVLRDDRGGFFSTQGTALALRAILAAAQSGQAGGHAKVLLDGSEVATIDFDPSNINEPQRVDLSDKIRPGAELKVTLEGWEGGADMAYRLSTHHFEPWTRAPVSRPVAAGIPQTWLQMSQRMDAKSYGLGDSATLSVDLWHHGPGAGLLIAQVGLPPGFRLAEHALDQGAIGPVQRVEPSARGLALYFEEPSNGLTSLRIPLVAARAVRSVVVPRSRVYSVYQPHIEAQAAPVPVFVRSLLGKNLGP